MHGLVIDECEQFRHVEAAWSGGRFGHDTGDSPAATGNDDFLAGFNLRQHCRQTGLGGGYGNAAQGAFLLSDYLVILNDWLSVFKLGADVWAKGAWLDPDQRRRGLRLDRVRAAAGVPALSG
jgi:hypothetical protein